MTATVQPSQSLNELTFSRYETYINPGMAVLVKFMGLDTVEVQSDGCYVTDNQGQRYLDCLGGPGVFTMGHRHPRVTEAVKAQIDRIPLSSHLLLNPLTGELAERLAQIAPGDLQCTFFCNSGAEAVEGALKVARMHTGRPHFVAAEGAFHGKTFGALSASGREVYRKPFEPLLDGFTHVAFGDPDALAQAVDEHHDAPWVARGTPQLRKKRTAVRRLQSSRLMSVPVRHATPCPSHTVSKLSRIVVLRWHGATAGHSRLPGECHLG